MSFSHRLLALRLLAFAAAAVCSVPAAAAPVVYPDLTVAPLEVLQKQMATTIHATRPDYVVFVPKVANGNINDTGNDHFLVFDRPHGGLMAVWTQSTREADPDQHIVLAQSPDRGRTWSEPRLLAGPRTPGDGFMASWGFPITSKSGRIYVLYFQNLGIFDTFPHTTGRLDGIYSDDEGKTWSSPQTVRMPRSSRDNPDISYPPNCIVWQKPQRLTRDGRYLVGFTRWTSKAVKRNPTGSWISHESVVEFMRFENIDENPEVAKLDVSWLARDKEGITVPYPGRPDVSVAQEPSIVKLPDGRLFSVMRTSAGSPYWTVSNDDGTSWSRAKPLRRKDGGDLLQHPLAPCPIYDTDGEAAGKGHYALFIHNHDGHYQGFGPKDTSYHRRAIYILRGHFKAGAEQPVWFDEPEYLMDHDGIPLGLPGKRGNPLSLYSSVTYGEKDFTLWYPERKFFLLGKRIQQNR